MRSTSQQYAEVAYRTLTEFAKSHPEKAKELGRLCHTFPSLVMLNGLRLTWIFFTSKDGPQDAHRHYLEAIREAVGIESGIDTLELKSADYRYMTRQMLDAAVWFKRYAEAILNVHSATEDSPARSNQL